MAKIVKQRLCGGTFFTLFLRARKPLRGANEYYTGNPEPYSEPIALFALSKVIVFDWQNIFVFADSTVSGNTSEYKTCKNEGGSIYPFGDDAALTAFNTRIKDNYPSVLAEMSKVIELLIDTGSMRKDERLIIELLALIEADDSIGDNQLFFASESGDGNTLIAHANAVNMKSVYIPVVQTSGVTLPTRRTVNENYYSLFVIGDELFTGGHFMVPKECALTESIAPELKAKYAKLDMGAITAIKTFPAIFASRNHQYSRAGENQDAYLGFVDEVIVQDNGIKVCFHLLYAISQRRLNNKHSVLRVVTTTKRDIYIMEVLT